MADGLRMPNLGDASDVIFNGTPSPSPSPTPGAGPTRSQPHIQVELSNEPPPPRRITPRPSFLENLADSRERQFMLDRRNSTDVDRYFVCTSLASGIGMSWLTENLARPQRPRQALEMAHLPATAWQCHAPIGPSTSLRRALVDFDYVHFEICSKP